MSGFFRFSVAVLAVSTFAFSQNLPAFRWVKQVDGSGVDSFAGLGVDALGNTYIAGSTYANTFPVEAAVQSQIASAGLYRIDGPGSAYTALGLTSASFVITDPLNPSTLYAGSNGTLLMSADDGATFASLTLPSSQVSILAINPVNDQILYAGTLDQGILKSADGGVTWNAANAGFAALAQSGSSLQAVAIWIDPTMPNVLFATVGIPYTFVRSADGGASWQTVSLPPYYIPFVRSVSFDTDNPGVLYGANGYQGGVKSADHGLTFTELTTPASFTEILPDPNHSGRLVSSGSVGIFESDDGGVTWTAKTLGDGSRSYSLLAADWANGYFYGVSQLVPFVVGSAEPVVRITTDLQTVTTVGPPSLGAVSGIATANGHAYVAVVGTRDVYVTKLDANGNVVYSTYFGGSGDDVAVGMAVDPSGGVYVAGTTTSLDFPITKGSYASTGGSFLFKLNSDGSLGYSTYFAPLGNTPAAIAVDAAGSAYLAGISDGGLPTTPGAYLTTCTCTISTVYGFLPGPPPGSIVFPGGFLTKFDPIGSSLIYSTYLQMGYVSGIPMRAMALAPDGTTYVGGNGGIFHLNAAGSAPLGALGTITNPSAIAIGPDGSLYAAVATGANPFPTTVGSFEPVPPARPALPNESVPIPATAIVKIDAQLANVLAATYFGGPDYAYLDGAALQFGSTPIAMTFDAAGNLYASGYTGPQSLPTRTPLQEGFAPTTGFLTEFSGDLSTLIFSSYFGDNEYFEIQGLGVDPDGTVRIGGTTGMSPPYRSAFGPQNIYVNSLALVPPPALRIDSVVNAASLLDGPISAGETIVIEGAGFGSDAQLMIGGAVVPAISVTTTAITAAMPESVGLTGVSEFQVQSGGAVSNLMLIPMSATSPGIFSQDGSGYGQGAILNKDGTLNTPSNPAAAGDRITIFATGVGPVTISQGSAATELPVSVFVDGYAATNVAAATGPVDGLPGIVYLITVTVPSPPNFQFPPLVGVLMQINGVNSQNGLAISIAQ